MTGNAVPMRATPIAPATRKMVPSEDTSPTAETTIDEDLFLFF